MIKQPGNKAPLCVCCAAKGGGKRVAWQETFNLEKASAGDEVEVQAWDKDIGSGRWHCTHH